MSLWEGPAQSGQNFRKGLGQNFRNPQEHCVPAPHRLLAFVLFRDNEEPLAYLIPTTVWLVPSGPFVSRDYGEGKKSAPEWGLTVSDKRLPELEAYRFGVTAAGLRTPPIT